MAGPAFSETEGKTEGSQGSQADLSQVNALWEHGFDYRD
jgi:hypothetical protein